MNFALLSDDWITEFRTAISSHPASLSLMSPFIKQKAVSEVFAITSAQNLRVITRFNKVDFAKGVSDIQALRDLLARGAEIRGIKDLHSKLYIFGEQRAIVTSANLTYSALHNNFEFGCRMTEPDSVDECVTYFNDLWARAGKSLEVAQLDRWEAEVQASNVKGLATPLFDNPDEGSDIGLQSVPIVPPQFSDAPASYVKFFGTASDRAPRSRRTIETLKGSGAHWACTYPITKRPTSVPDGSSFFMAQMVEAPNDFMIFGRAVGMKHLPGRDEATAEDIAVRPWKETWPLYIRVHDGEYLGGTLGNGVSLYDLFRDFGSNALESTRRNLQQGDGNADPFMSVRQQAAVRLTADASEELNRRLQSAFEQFGTIPAAEIDELDKPSVRCTLH